MIDVKKESLLLTKIRVGVWEESVVKPEIIGDGDIAHIFYRAAQLWNQSSIGYCLLNGHITIIDRWDRPIIVPEFQYGSPGIEDPWIVVAWWNNNKSS